jgi:AraC-like DNA-binding protein
MTIHAWVATAPKMPSKRPNRPCRDLVEHAEALALADLDEPLHVSALCSALAVSERTLRKAFHKTHGLPPCRHLRMLRLSQARRALLSADCKFATVTEIATSFGFVELGRFSVEYRKAFGECPSQTLHRTSPDRTLAVKWVEPPEQPPFGSLRTREVFAMPYGVTSSTFPKFESYRSATTTNNNRHSGARVTREARDKRARNP